MLKQYVLGIDVGTSGCKSIIVDEAGNVVGSETSPLDIISEKQGYSEQDPMSWWNAAKLSISKLSEKHSAVFKDIKAIGLSAQMHGLVALDKDKKVIRRAILWNDQRTVKQCEAVYKLAGGEENLLNFTNNKMLPGYTGGKILWLKEYEPENYSKAQYFINPKDYIRLCLTGDIATDVSDASGTGLFDVKNKVWSSELLRLLDIPEDKLPKVYESSDITGHLTRSSASALGLPSGIPVSGGGGDAVIQTTGTGVIDSSKIMTTIGTAGVVASGIDEFKKNEGGLVQFFSNNMADTWHIMGVTLSAGASYKWFAEMLGSSFKETACNKGSGNIYEYLNTLAADSIPGSRNLIYLPYLNGERCPYTDPSARACFIGFTLRHGLGDMARSILEGVIFSLRDVYELIKGMNGNQGVDEIRTSGGGALSPLWRQIHSDIFQIPVTTVSGAAEGGAYGAALVAGVSVGIWKDIYEAVSNIKIITRTEPNPENRNIYNDLYGIYSQLYKDLKPSFERLVEK
jgi:xylulokinase